MNPLQEQLQRAATELQILCCEQCGTDRDDKVEVLERHVLTPPAPGLRAIVLEQLALQDPFLDVLLNRLVRCRSKIDIVYEASIPPNSLHSRASSMRHTGPYGIHVIEIEIQLP